MAGLWYRAGTVSVTNGSNKITGFGTTWKTGGSRPDKGHTFWGPDGKHYEVDSIESDTVLYLVKPYTGVTAAGQPYEIDITRTSTIPAVSREVAALLAYAQSQYDAWQAILTGVGDVTLTAPDGQTVTVPALANMLSKSGNLAGLTDKPAALGNLGLGDAATKNVGVAAGSVAAGDHEHTQTIIVAGDPSTYYPVRFIGAAIRHGIGISRDVHRDGTWAGSLRMHIIGAGAAWGGDYPFLDYEFSQLWTEGGKGVLADVAVATDAEGIYVWLRGGRTYSVTGVGLAATVYLSGVTEGNGTVFAPKLTGPLSGCAMASSLDGPQLYRGPIANNKPYWNGENLPVIPGAFTPTINLTGVEILKAGGKYWRKGDRCDFEIDFTFGSLADGAAGDTSSLIIQSLPFVKADTGMVHIISLMERNLRVDKPVAYVNGSTVELLKRVGEDTIPVKVQDIKPKTYGRWVTITLSGWYPIA